MDLGAMVCRPRNPDCAACPLSADCAAALAGEPESYPRRAAAKARPVRFGAAYFAFRRDGAFLARRRPPKGLLGATLELPGPPWRTAEDGGASEARAVRGALAAPAGRSRAGLHPFHAAARRLCRGGRRGAGRSGRRCSGSRRRDADSAGFSSVMLKAIAHAKAAL